MENMLSFILESDKKARKEMEAVQELKENFQNRLHQQQNELFEQSNAYIAQQEKAIISEEEKRAISEIEKIQIKAQHITQQLDKEKEEKQMEWARQVVERVLT